MGMDKLHDWVTIDVSDDFRIHQCARCRIVFFQYCTVRNGVPTAAGEYHPAHVANPQNCTRGDMTEETAAESGAEAAELVAEIVADLRKLDTDWGAYVAAGLDGVDEGDTTCKALADYIEQKWGKK